MSKRYKKEKDGSSFLTFALTVVALFIFSIIAAVVALNLPSVIYLFGNPYLPMSISYFIFGLIVLVWGSIIIIFMRINKKNK